MDKRIYTMQVQPQEMDFTRKSSLPGLLGNILNTVGEDAHVLGFGSDMLVEKNMGWVLSTMALELDRRPAECETFSIHTWISSATRLTSVRNMEFVDAEGKVFARGVTTWCIIDYSIRRPVNMDILGDLAKETITPVDSPCAAPLRLRPITPEVVSLHKVAYSDIDFNRHMNTLKYIDLMLNMLPLSYLEEDSPLRLDVHFASECAYGQNLKVGYLQDGPASQFSIDKEDGTPSCRAQIQWR